MEIIIHDVNEISLGIIDKLRNDELDKTYTRHLKVKTEKGENLEITCFGENLKVEIEERRKV